VAHLDDGVVVELEVGPMRGGGCIMINDDITRWRK
jgi:hypothetical protein